MSTASRSYTLPEPWPEEGLIAEFDANARRVFHISGDDFRRKWLAREIQDDEPERHSELVGLVLTMRSLFDECRQ